MNMEKLLIEPLLTLRNLGCLKKEMTEITVGHIKLNMNQVLTIIQLFRYACLWHAVHHLILKTITGVR